MRAGAQTLTLLGGPRTALILESLAEGPQGLFALRRDIGSAAQSTMRGHLKTLEGLHALTKRWSTDWPSGIEYELTEPGLGLLPVLAGLRDWLRDAPGGPLETGGERARAAIKGLVLGWSTGVSPALASEARSLTELDKRIPAVSYPTIARCLETLRLAEQIETRARDSRGTPYALTDWLRRGLAPLALAGRWEHENEPSEAEPIAREDIAAAISILSPLIDRRKLPAGICQLSLSVPAGGARPKRLMGTIEVASNGISWGSVYPRQKPDAWASGNARAWFTAILDGDLGGLRPRGDRGLPHDLLTALRAAVALRPAAGAF